MGGRGQSSWGAGLRKGKDAGCEGDDADGTRSGAGLAVSPDVFHGPRRLFKRKPAPADHCEQYRATAVLRSLGSKSTFEGPTGDY